MSVETQFETLEVKKEKGVVWATINRPKVLNALNYQVLSDLTNLVDQLVAESTLRVLVLQGAGEKSFVAGADIASMRELTSDQAQAFANLGQELTLKLEAAPFVTIAKVQGFALGGGCELAMACDIIIAADSAIIGQPEVALGLIPGFGGTQRLAGRVGLPLALDVLLGGRKLKGNEALQCGLISQCVEKDKLEDAVVETISRILKAAPAALRETKRLSRAALEVPLKHGLDAEASAFANCFSRPESQEGISAFLEKRNASFSL